jgi:hypothetical protein
MLNTSKASNFRIKNVSVHVSSNVNNINNPKVEIEKKEIKKK